MSNKRKSDVLLLSPDIPEEGLQHQQKTVRRKKVMLVQKVVDSHNNDNNNNNNNNSNNNNSNDKNKDKHFSQTIEKLQSQFSQQSNPDDLKEDEKKQKLQQIRGEEEEKNNNNNNTINLRKRQKKQNSTIPYWTPSPESNNKWKRFLEREKKKKQPPQKPRCVACNDIVDETYERQLNRIPCKYCHGWVCRKCLKATAIYCFVCGENIQPSQIGFGAEDGSVCLNCIWNVIPKYNDSLQPLSKDVYHVRYVSQSPDQKTEDMCHDYCCELVDITRGPENSSTSSSSDYNANNSDLVSETTTIMSPLSTSSSIEQIEELTDSFFERDRKYTQFSTDYINTLDSSEEDDS